MSKIRDEIRKELAKELCLDGNKKYSDKYNFYYKDLADNLIGDEMSEEHKKMFQDASGGELEDKIIPAKAKAIDSSSMLSYNFFRIIDEDNELTIDNVTYNKCFFEVKLPTLATSNAQANLDVVLISRSNEDVLFIESKFLEYLDSDSEDLADSYKKLESYFEDNKEIKDLLNMSKSYEIKKGRYNYGIKQNICHLIAISNLLNSEEAKNIFKKRYEGRDQAIISDAKNYKFVNLIFKPNNSEGAEKYELYIKGLEGFREKLPESVNKYCCEKFVMTYWELFEKLPYSEELKKKLQERYIKFHYDSSPHQ